MFAGGPNGAAKMNLLNWNCAALRTYAAPHNPSGLAVGPSAAIQRQQPSGISSRDAQHIPAIRLGLIQCPIRRHDQRTFVLTRFMAGKSDADGNLAG